LNLLELLEQGYQGIDGPRRIDGERGLDMVAIGIIGRRRPFRRQRMGQPIAGGGGGPLAIGRGRWIFAAVVARLAGIGFQYRQLKLTVPYKVVGDDRAAAAGALRTVQPEQETLEAGIVFGGGGQLGQRRPQVGRRKRIDPALENEAGHRIAEGGHHSTRLSHLDGQERRGPKRVEQPSVRKRVAAQQARDRAAFHRREEPRQRARPFR
jgi:hypothetical protein